MADADETGKFCREKVKFQKFSRKSKKFSKIGGKSETGGKMHHGLRGGWTPLLTEKLLMVLSLLQI